AEVAYAPGWVGHRVTRMVYNPRTKRLSGQPRRPLEPGTKYRVVYNGEGDAHQQVFTTMSATRVLTQMRRQLESGSAYAAAGIPKGNARRLRFDILEGGGRAVFNAIEVGTMTRYNDRFKGKPLQKEQVIEVAAARNRARYYAFGYYNSPQWVTRNRYIPQTSTRTEKPEVRRREKVGFTMIVPAGPTPEGGWPTAIFGPGITRSKYDLFLAADTNASRGIATISLDPVGHAFGPRGKFGVTSITGGGEQLMPQFGRARDTNAQGEYDAITNVSAPLQPHRLASIALRDGLRQTAADVMALVRAINRGVDVDADGTVDLRRTNVALYAQSLGGIYGTMVAGVDNRVQVAALNVPGGPIVEIARLAPAFRANVAYALGHHRPSLLNGGLDCFTESAPLWGQKPVTKPAKGAAKIQAYAARANWLNRPGSPEAFAPLLRHDPLADSKPKRFFYQFAFGDETVPNPTSWNLLRAGRFPGRVSFYRNDRTPTRGENPHGFLLDPRITGRQQAQAQVIDFIARNGEGPIDPDGPGNTWETPIFDRRSLRQLNYDLEAGVKAREQYSGKGCPEG
ncbi:MAG: hypothetical protein KY444_09900, partial [Gemmatimonadetes bacterium]|nr:hypothetical protein [Gemmatimonadota bacterium]